jgi:hypothetical protein
MGEDSEATARRGTGKECAPKRGTLARNYEVVELRPEELALRTALAVRSQDAADYQN